MAETVNQEQTTSTPAAPAERTFTQSELDAIVVDRLGRERQKYADYEDLKVKAARYEDAETRARQGEVWKQELDALKKAEAVRLLREKVAGETGVPASLLTGETEEACRAQAEGMLTWKGEQKPAGYPEVRDAGEIHAGGGTTRDRFADWFSAALTK